MSSRIKQEMREQTQQKIETENFETKSKEEFPGFRKYL
jgi:hypothetical protein